MNRKLMFSLFRNDLVSKPMRLLIEEKKTLGPYISKLKS
jgi:hypothetical protein